MRRDAPGALSDVAPSGAEAPNLHQHPLQKADAYPEGLSGSDADRDARPDARADDLCPSLPDREPAQER